MIDITNLSVFSGIGGIEIAGEWAGIRTIGQVEISDHSFLGIGKTLARCLPVEGH